MADQITSLESSIVARLAAQMTGILVLPFPNTAAEYQNLELNRDVVLVSYGGSSANPPAAQVKSGTVPKQERRMEILISVMAADLRAFSGEVKTGIYPMLEAVRVALSGFAPTGGRPLTFLGDQFVRVTESYWLFMSRFETWTWIA